MFIPGREGSLNQKETGSVRKREAGDTTWKRGGPDRKARKRREAETGKGESQERDWKRQAGKTVKKIQ